MSLTNLPALQSFSSAENAGLPGLSVQRTIPMTFASDSLAPTAMIVLPSNAQWMARATVNFGSVLQLTGFSLLLWISIRQRSLSLLLSGSERIAITFLPVVGAHARSP